MKRFSLVALIFLLVFSLLPVQKADAAQFSDVPERHGFYSEIQYLLDRGVSTRS